MGDPLSKATTGRSPYYRSKGGVVLYEKMPEGYLSFYHYVGGPSGQRTESLKSEHMGSYRSFLSYHNGCIMYDKVFSIFGVGQELKRGFSLDDIGVFSFEDENPTFRYIRDEQGAMRTWKIGAIDLVSSFSIILNEEGKCELVAEESQVKLLVGSVNTIVQAIISVLEENFTYGKKASLDQLRSVQDRILILGTS